MSKEVEIYQDEARCGTFLIAQGFDREHNRVLRLIKKHEERFLRLENNSFSKSLIIRRVPPKKGGRPVDEIMLNEEQAIFLGSIFRNTDRVLDFKEKLARDFVSQKKILQNITTQRQSPEWIAARAEGKTLRREETDTIKDFVEYATTQGSKNAKRYYTGLSNLVNNKLFTFNGEFKSKRDAMTGGQLILVGAADTLISRALLEGMSLGMEYHDVYKLVKERVIQYAGLIGQTEVISQQLLKADETIGEIKEIEA